MQKHENNPAKESSKFSLKIAEIYPIIIILLGILQGIVLYKISDISIKNNSNIVYSYLIILTLPFCIYLGYINLLSIIKQFCYALFITGVSLFVYFLTDIKIENQSHYHLSSYYDNYKDNIIYFSSFYVSLLVIGFPLFLGIKIEKFRLIYDYKLLFNISWKNIFTVFIGSFLTLISFGLIYLSAYLFKIININIFIELLGKEFIIIPTICGLFALNITILKNKIHYVDNIRRYWLGLNSIFFYFIAFASIIWLASTPFTGLETLFNTKMATTILAIYIVTYIKLINCVYEDGELVSNYSNHKVLKYIPYAVTVLIGLFLIACFALYIRTDKYGLTISRINAWISIATLSIYVFGYSLSSLRRKIWMFSIPITNIIAAGFILITNLILTSPLIDLNHIVIKNQVAKLINNEINVDNFDFYHLKRLGREGQDELKKLANLKNHSSYSQINTKAQQALSSNSNYDYSQKTQKDNNLPQIKIAISKLPIYIYDRDSKLSSLSNSSGNSKSNSSGNSKISDEVKSRLEQYFTKYSYNVSECMNISTNTDSKSCMLWIANLSTDTENKNDSQIYLVTKHKICGFNADIRKKEKNYDEECDLNLNAYNADFAKQILDNKLVITMPKYFSLQSKESNKEYTLQ